MEVRGAQALRRAVLVGGGVVLLLLSTWLFFWNLGASSISARSDEVIYVRMVQGILHRGELFPIYHGNNPSYEKPPLKLWAAAVAPWLMGESNFSFRVFDALLGVVAVVLSVGVGWRLFGRPLGALAVGFLTLMAPEWVLFQHSFRTAVLDGLLIVVTLGMGWATVVAVEASQAGRSPRRGVWIIAMLGCVAVLTKSVAGFVPLGCSVATMLAVRGFQRPTRAELRRLCGVWWPLLLPVVVWAGYIAVVALVGGARGVGIFIGVEILDRVFTGFAGHNTGNRLFYLQYAFQRGGLAPAALLALGTCGALILMWRNWRYRLVLIWCWLPLVAYSFSSSRAPWYVSPCVPWAAMSAVFGVVGIVLRWRSWLVQGVAAVVVVFLVAAPYSRALTRSLRYVGAASERIELDTVIERLRGSYARFVIVGSAVSGRSNPVQGKFNVEGIYREMLRPHLVAVQTPEEYKPEPGQVVFIREEDVSRLPAGGVVLETIQPFGVRQHRVVVVLYGEGGDVVSKIS
jgi:4-amino-4-deoxy-L-arabinose transferase-like glycosyltransferase